LIDGARAALAGDESRLRCKMGLDATIGDGALGLARSPTMGQPWCERCTRIWCVRPVLSSSSTSVNGPSLVPFEPLAHAIDRGRGILAERIVPHDVLLPVPLLARGVRSQRQIDHVGWGWIFPCTTAMYRLSTRRCSNWCPSFQCALFALGEDDARHWCAIEPVHHAGAGELLAHVREPRPRPCERLLEVVRQRAEHRALQVASARDAR
jgi:hypothetical protein